MENKSLLNKSSQSGEKKALNEEEKIEVEFAVVRRIYAREFVAIKTSFEEWANQWPQ